jgi:2,4-dienoyl-CoA reductase-like NADH-dependent reductase (Old Yellow Enzyme family)
MRDNLICSLMGIYTWTVDFFGVFFMPHIFDPLTLRDITLRNRLGVSPMCMYSSEDGHATDWHLVHLGSRAVGGWGLIVAEATAVTPEGRISPQDAGLWKDSQIQPLERITRFIKTHGGTPGIQLAHAGRKASTARLFSVPKPGKALSPAEGGWPVVAPSPLAFDQQSPVPHELTVAEIKDIQAAFAAAAVRALHAGYELLEIHGAHGYLINEFLSPLTNQRGDAYGGSFDNRIRMLMETIEAIHQVWPERLPLAVRLSCVDWVEGGWTLEDSVALARKLKAAEVDLVDCSSGAVVPHARIPVGPGFQVPFAQAIRRDAGIATAAVGMITDAAQAAEIIATGQADVVFMARHALLDPYFPIHAAATLNMKEAVRRPGQYGRA